MSCITVNGKYTLDIEIKGETLSSGGKEVVFDVQKIEGNTFHILYKNRSYNAEMISIQDKDITVKINSTEYLVAFRDEYAELLESLGMTHEKKNGSASLKAPMPGLVLNIMVQVGDVVCKGGNLLVLEAMKMENIIKAANDVIIKSVEIEKGAKVEKNQVLITFE